MTNAEYLQQINDNLMQELTKQEGAMPPGFNRKRFVLNCVTMIQDMMKDSYKLEKLMTVSMDSVITCLMKGAYLGLDFFNGECYAIPYGPSGKEVAEAKKTGRRAVGKMNFQTDYKGEIKLAKKYSKNPIKDIFAKVVREGDEFYEEVDGGVQKVYFKPRVFSNADMVGAFAIATFKDGSMIYETMSREEIEAVRTGYSKAPDSEAWKKSTGEMYKKTVLRRLCKLIDLNFDNIEQMRAFDDGGDAEFNQIPEKARPLAIPAKENPIDVSAQIRSAKKAEPVPVQVQKPSQQKAAQQEPTRQETQQQDDEFARFEQQYEDWQPDIPEGYENELPFR